MRTDDGCIVQDCLSGDPGAFGMLVDKYKAGIYAFVYDKLCNFQDAEDVTQEVFLKAYCNLRSLRRWESFGFWLYRIARNQCKKWVRTQSRRPDSVFVEDQDAKLVEKPSVDAYRVSQMDESLREALDSLSEIYREVLILHYFGGMTIKNIARATGASPTAIGMRLSRARLQLRKEMVAMMDTAFEGQRLQASFTFRIVEAVKRIKIHPMPRMAGLPWGLSVAAGFIITVLSLSPHLSITSDMAIPAGSLLSADVRVLRTGEIPVDILKTSEISVMDNMQGNDDGLATLRAFMLAPQQDEGGTWTQKADMPTPRDGLSSCVIDGKIYAIGGAKYQPEIFFPTLEEYNPETDKWTRRADMPTARVIDNCASVVNGKIYAIGGWNGAKTLATVEEYDPKADAWIKKADMPTERGYHGVCAVNGKIYAIGGYLDGNTSFSIVEEYDPVTDTWTRKADMPTPRCCLDTVALNGKIYAIGGSATWKNGPDLSVVEEYDPVTDTWARKADMLFERSFLSAVALDGKVYAIGGARWKEGAWAIHPSPEVYNPATDTWTELPDMQVPRYYLSSSVVNGKIYAVGGNAGNMTAVSTVEEYTPEGWQSAERSAVSPHDKLPTKWGEVKSE